MNEREIKIRETKIREMNEREIKIREIIVGDYANIKTYVGIIYRYYITKIEPGTITVAQFDDPKQILLLKPDILDNKLYQSEAYKDSHAIFFSKNETNLEYYGRDYVKPSNKILIIEKYRKDTPNAEYIELINGIILYQLHRKQTILGFADPNNGGKTFLQVVISNTEETCKFLNSVNDSIIFIYLKSQMKIIKFNLQDLSLTDYDYDPERYNIYPLKDKKILCITYHELYILDLVTNTTTDIISSRVSGQVAAHQLSTGDIILEQLISGINPTNLLSFSTDLHLIKDDKLYPLITFVDWISIIAILTDDKFLLLNSSTKTIQLYYSKIQSTKSQSIKSQSTKDSFNEIFSLSNQGNVQKLLGSITSPNGDVLFNVTNKFYLFNHYNDTVVPLLSLDTNDKFIGNIGYNRNFKQLKNGNLILSNGAYLTMAEFPLTQNAMDRLNFDKISDQVAILAADMLILIRDEL